MSDSAQTHVPVIAALGIKVFNQQDVEQAVSSQMDRAIVEQDQQQQLSRGRRNMDVSCSPGRHRRQLPIAYLYRYSK